MEPDPDPDGPLHFRPTRFERRGDFPAHDDARIPQRPLSAAVAKRLAAQRLADWRRDHGRR